MNAKFYCLSLSRLEEYLVGKKRLSAYPLNSWVNHAIRQIMDLAMLTFEQKKLVVPALPSSFTIDGVPEAFKDDFKEILEKTLNEWSTSPITIQIVASNEKMNIFLKDQCSDGG